MSRNLIPLDPPRIRLSDLSRIILAAELTTRPNFRGESRHSDALQEIAYRSLFDLSMPNHMKIAGQDAKVICEAVWFDFMKPLVKGMLMELKQVGEEDAEKLLMLYYVDETPRRDPPRTSRR